MNAFRRFRANANGTDLLVLATLAIFFFALALWLHALIDQHFDPTEDAPSYLPAPASR